MLRTLVTLFLLTLIASTALSQDCDSNGLSDIAELGPFTPEPGGGLLFQNAPPNAEITGLDYAVAGQSFTIEMWIYRNAATGDQEYFLSAGSFGVPNQGLVIGFRADRRFVFAFWANDLETTTVYPPDGQWHHWVCRYDATTNARWILRDGVIVAFDTAPSDFVGPMNTMYLGGLGNTFNFNGIIDEVRIFDYPRSDAEILNDINLQYSQVGLPAGLHAYYQLDNLIEGNDLAGNNHALFPAPTTNSYTTYESDCNGNGVPDDCDFTDMFSFDCNSNGIPDECDIASGFSLDCNSNGIPDECEPDCNSNGIPDECDITSVTSNDCNSNGIPDECDIAAAMSLDCNSNGIPDECDIVSGFSRDCNVNGIPDQCDIDTGSSTDTNTNGVPDECESIYNKTADTYWTTLDNAIEASVPRDRIILQPGVYVVQNSITKGITIEGTDPDNLEQVFDTVIFGTQPSQVGPALLLLNPDESQEYQMVLRGIRTGHTRAAAIEGQLLIDRVIDNPIPSDPYDSLLWLQIDFQSLEVEIHNSLSVRTSSSIGFLNRSGSSPNGYIRVVQSVLHSGNENAIEKFLNISNAPSQNIEILQSTILGQLAIDLSGANFGSLTIENSIVRGVISGLDLSWITSLSNSNIEGEIGDPADNLIDEDPLLVDSTTLQTDKANGNYPFLFLRDYTLQDNAPSIDTGSNLLIPTDVLDLDEDGDVTEQLPLDLAGQTRIANSTVDMGPYEYQGPPCPADLTDDGALDFFDVSAFLTAFGNQDPAADFTGDSSFDFFDVSAFLTAFGMGCP